MQAGKGTAKLLVQAVVGEEKISFDLVFIDVFNRKLMTTETGGHIDNLDLTKAEIRDAFLCVVVRVSFVALNLLVNEILDGICWSGKY